MTNIVKAYGWENVQSGKCRSRGGGDVLQVSFHWESVRSGKYPSRNCPSGKYHKVRIPIYQLNFLRRTALKSSIKGQ